MKTCESGQTKESGGKGDRSEKRKARNASACEVRSVPFHWFLCFFLPFRYEINHPNRSTTADDLRNSTRTIFFIFARKIR